MHPPHKYDDYLLHLPKTSNLTMSVYKETCVKLYDYLQLQANSKQNCDFC